MQFRKTDRPKKFGIIDAWRAFADKKESEGWNKTGSVNYRLIKIEKDGFTYTYDMFVKILNEYYLQATKYLIYGMPFRLGTNLGMLKACRIEHGETLLHKRRKPITFKKGAKAEYYGGKDYCIIVWRTDRGFTNNVPNRRFYKFRIATNNTGDGFKDRFLNSWTKNDELKQTYDYFWSQDPNIYGT